MRTRTSDFKREIKEFGRQIDSKITFDNLIYIGAENIFSVKPILNAELLKSTMKGLNFESDEDIDVDTRFKYEFGLLVNDEIEWINFGYYYVTKKEYNEDKKTWNYTCYDQLRKSMVDYEGLNAVEFPITVRDFISEICDDLGITFANASDTFVNYNRVIQSDPYVGKDNTPLGYLYRDILDDLSAVVAGNLCINDDDELEIRYVNNSSVLPREYTRVDYIKNSGTQYIDTGFIPDFDNGFKFEIEYTPTNLVNRGCLLSNYSGTNHISFELGYNGWQQRAYINNGNVDFIVQSATLDKNLGSVSYYNGVVTNIVNGNSATKNYIISGQSGQNLLMFVDQIKRFGTFTNYIKVYSCKIYDGTTLVRDYIPCYRNSDNEAGMYDLVNGVFYTNAGTGDFIIGDVVLDTIDGEYLKDVNVKFAEKFGPLNTIILSRSAESDEVFRTYPSDLPEADRIAFKIVDNQIMNGNDRGDYCGEILDKLKGLEFYLNDFNSTGVLYYELLDLYNVSIDEEDNEGNITTNTYKCLMLNDEPNVTQGLTERIFTDMPGKAVTDYSNMTKDDRELSQAYLIVKKNEGEIEGLVYDMDDPQGKFTQLKVKVDGMETTVTNNSNDITIIKQSISGLQVDITKKGENLIRNTMLWNYDGWLANNFEPLASGETPPEIIEGAVNVIYWYCTQSSSVYEAGIIYEYDFIDEEWKPTNYLRKDFYNTADDVVGLSIVEDKNNYLSGNKFVLQYDGTSTTGDLGFFSEQFEISPIQDMLTFQFKLKSTINTGKVAVELMLFNDEYVNRIDMDNYLVGGYFFVIDTTKDIDTYKVQVPLNSVLTVISGSTAPESLSSLWLDTSGVQNVLKKYNTETTSWEIYNTPNVIKDQNNQYYRWAIYNGGNIYRVWNDSIKIIRGQVALLIYNDGVQYPNATIEIGDIKAEYGVPTDWGPRQDEVYSITHKMDSIGYTIQKGENKLFLDEDELTGYFKNGKMFYINKNEVYSKVSKSEVSNVNGLVTKKITVNGNTVYIRYIEGV